MATKKDLLEAHSFTRRRLVTAFVSGAPGGREVEPSRPGRTIVGGAGLAVLLVAGAAVAGSVAPRTEIDWTRPGLIQAKETGASFVVLDTDSDGDGEHDVRPVLNITSAQLILGGALEPTGVAQADISARSPGETIGILEAPSTPPSASRLLGDGWTVCTQDRAGLMTTLDEKPPVRSAPGAGFLVRSQGALFVIAEAAYDGPQPSAASPDEAPRRAVAYPLPADPQTNDNVLSEIGVAERRAEAVRVPRGFVTLFPAGGELSRLSFDLPDLGTPPPYLAGSGLPASARTGDFYEIDGDYSVLTRAGPAPIDDFALAVYRNLDWDPRPQELEVDTAPPGPRAESPSRAAGWPAATLTSVTGPLCAVLETGAGVLPAAHLALAPSSEASAAAVSPRRRDAQVQAGHGAYVLSGSWSDAARGTAFLIDERAQSHELVGLDVPTRLGYGDVVPAVVPDSWVKLLDPGVPLSVDAALCPASLSQTVSCR